jgi:hypothetical protein
MSEFAVEHRQALEEFMRVDVFLEKLQIIRMPSFRDLYCALGIYSDLIVREYGAALFNRKSQPEIIADVESRISPNPSIFFSKNARGDTSETYEEIICAHERSIASLVSDVAASDARHASALLEKDKESNATIAERDQLHARILALESSKSWRLMAPAQWVVKRVKSMMQG